MVLGAVFNLKKLIQKKLDPNNFYKKPLDLTRLHPWSQCNTGNQPGRVRTPPANHCTRSRGHAHLMHAFIYVVLFSFNSTECVCFWWMLLLWIKCCGCLGDRSYLTSLRVRGNDSFDIKCLVHLSDCVGLAEVARHSILIK